MSVDTSTDISVDISIEVCRSTYQPSDGRHIDRLSADILVDVAADTRPIHWPLTIDYRRNIGRLSYNIGQNFRLSLSDV